MNEFAIVVPRVKHAFTRSLKKSLSIRFEGAQL
jgi:hypothetical protein